MDVFEILQWVFAAVTAFFVAREVRRRFRAVQSVIHADANPDATWVPKGARWRWARGAWSLWLGDVAEHRLTREVSRQMLEDIGAGTAAAVEHLVRDIDERAAERVTWADVRVIATARLAVAASVWGDFEAAQRIDERARRIRARFDDWESLGQRFVEEHESVVDEGGSADPYDERRQGRSTTLNRIRDHRDAALGTIWTAVAFDQDLDAGWNADEEAVDAVEQAPRRRRKRVRRRRPRRE